MSSRKIHKIIGLALLVPLLGWILTGLIFFIKPGYKEAYQQLSVKTYPLEAQLTVLPKHKWQEIRFIKTVLGEHLLVKTNGKVEHLEPSSLKVKELPTSQRIRQLIEDAISNNKERYGEVVSISGNQAQTSTGVEINIDWVNLRLSQKGKDTELINLMYKIHYLQWTPFNNINRLLGFLGLLLLAVLSFLGVKAYFQNR